MELVFAENGARFDKTMRYRFALWRIWDNGLPIIMFIGLNPSTPNETSDDPTIRKVKGIAVRLGYGGIHMLNLFTFITSNPKDLTIRPKPTKEDNRMLTKYADKSKTICFAWGAFKEARERAKEIIDMFPDAKCLGINNDGSPRHPLYIPYGTQLINFKQEMGER